MSNRPYKRGNLLRGEPRIIYLDEIANADNTSDHGMLIEEPVIYILTHEGTVINVYRDYMDAIEAAVAEVTEDPENTLVDSYDSIIYVDGCKGEVAILVEQLL